MSIQKDAAAGTALTGISTIRLRTVVAVAVFLLLHHSVLGAQAASERPANGLALGAKLGLTATALDESRGLATSLGLGGLVRYTANDIGLGVSAEYTRFSETPDVDVTLFGLFLQPSVYVTTASHSTTLLGLRIGRVQKTVGVGGESFTAGGWALGATAGVQMWLTRTVGVEGGLVYDRMWYGDAATGGSVLPGSATGGWSLGMNVAFVFQVLRLAR